jgi:hypothetical protein
VLRVLSTILRVPLPGTRPDDIVSNQAKIVLWLGFFMIAFGIVKNWSTISATLFSGGSAGGVGTLSQNTYGVKVGGLSQAITPVAGRGR